MEDLSELYEALRNADKAGDVAGATRLAEYIQSLGDSTVGAPPAKLSKSPREMLEDIQPTAPPTPETLPKGGPVSGAIGTAVGLGQNLGAGLAGQVAALPTAIRNIGSPTREAEDVAARVTRKFAREPTTQTEKEYTEKVGETLGSLPPVFGENFSLVGPGARQAVGIARDATSKAGEAASRAASSVTRAVLPTPSPEALALARKAQAFGIDLPPDALYDSKFARILGQAFEEAPLSGSRKEARVEAFNKSLIRQIGGDPKATRLTPDIYEQAMSKYGKLGDDLAERTPVNVNNRGFQDRMIAFSNDLAKSPPDHQRVVLAYAKDLVSQAQNGVVPGAAMKRLTGQLKTQIRETTDGTLRRQLTNFKNILDGELMLNMSKADRLKYRDAMTKYAKGMTLEPLVARATGTEGNISPTGLMGAVARKQGKRHLARGTSGEMGDLAAIGQRFLKEPSSSLTAERNLVYGGWPGLAKWAAAVGPANLYNRLGPSISRAITGAPSPSRTPHSGILSRLGGKTSPLIEGALNRVPQPSLSALGSTSPGRLLPSEIQYLTSNDEGE